MTHKCFCVTYFRFCDAQQSLCVTHVPQRKWKRELSLRWMDKYEKREREEMPLGLILCADASYEHVELLRLEESGMYVAEYLTDLPPRRLLEAKLHEAIRLAREQIAVREGMGMEG